MNKYFLKINNEFNKFNQFKHLKNVENFYSI